ncbi:MAG TPA: hypothetical protein VKS79_00305 [Gemmataceae bacterium]|nr:hypothetical protein [Gemmataceae bacterium]
MNQAMQATGDNLQPIRLAQPVWIGVGVVAAVSALACAAGSLSNPRQFYFSYLTAWLFGISLGVGALFWIMLHYLSGATWSIVVRRQWENIAISVLPLALLFVPILLGLKYLYEWAQPVYPGAVDTLAHKRAYLNTSRFAIFAVVFLAGWCWMAFRLRLWSMNQDLTGDPEYSRLPRWHSATGMIFLALSTTVAAFDWIMSLEPHWTSTMYGVYFWAGAIVGSLALLIVVVTALRGVGILRHTVTAEHLHDLGKLLFAFVIFWAYIAFCQYFLIWYANVSEETPWYLHRLAGSWRWFALALPIGHFIVPFLILLRRDTKRQPLVLGLAAAWVLAFHYIDLYWQVLPTLHRDGAQPHWLDAATLLFMCSVVAGAVLYGLTRAALVPLRDPGLVPLAAVPEGAKSS